MSPDTTLNVINAGSVTPAAPSTDPGPDAASDPAPSVDPREAGVIEAIDAIRPALQADGGDIVFRTIDPDGVVHVDLVGACGTCEISSLTLKAGVERIVMDRVPGVTEVVAD